MQSILPLAAGLFTAVVWVAGGIMAPVLPAEFWLLVLLQSALAVLVVWAWLTSREWRNPYFGPGIMTALALHILSKYGIFNISSAFFPSQTFIATDTEPVWFAYATLAALIMALGCIMGVRLVERIQAPKLIRRLRPSADFLNWLPTRRILLLSAMVIILMLLYATIKYSQQWGIQEWNVGLSPLDQLIVYGVLNALPFAPILSSLALLKTSNSSERLRIWVLSFFLLAVTVTCLTMWHMRLWAMLSVGCSLWLWARAGVIRRWVFWMVIPLVLLAVYTAVTQVRLSDLPNLLAEKRVTEISGTDVLHALATTNAVPGSGDSTTGIGHSLLLDLSYAWAGLDAPAAVIKAQTAGLLPLQWGSVIKNGFLSALPAGLRPENATLLAVKSIGMERGILPARDYIAALLLEFVYDYGVVLVFFPALLFGIGAAGIDYFFRFWGAQPHMGGLRIVRLLWLTQVVFAGSTAGVSVLFVKSAFGLIVLFVLLGWLSRRSPKYRLLPELERRKQ